MSTNFYVADPRLMTPDEVECAERFDESALVCSKSKGPDGSVYTLEIHPLVFHNNLPTDTRVVNDNNNPIRTIGELIAAVRQSGSTVVTPAEAQVAAKDELAELRRDRGDEPAFAGMLPEELPPSRSRVEEYCKRYKRRLLGSV